MQGYYIQNIISPQCNILKLFTLNNSHARDDVTNLIQTIKEDNAEMSKTVPFNNSYNW